MKTAATLRAIAIALLFAAAASTARADNPVNGASLYAARCQNCHGSSPLGSNSNKIFNGRNARAVIDAAISNVADMNSLRSALPAGGSGLADLAAYLGNAPTALNFASTMVGATSAAATVTVYASLKSGNSITGLAVATTGDFARAGGTCGTSVATGTSCSVLVTFSPTAAGARSGTLSLSHGNTATPVAIALSGVGTAVAAPVASIAPSTLAFASTAIGATSAAQNVTVSNTGNAALAISSIAVAGADFTLAGGTCTAGSSVAAGTSCTVSIAFAPGAGALGARMGTLTIGHNAAGSPSSVGLNGSAAAAAAPVASLTSSLAFGSIAIGSTSTTQTATLANTGTAPLTIATLSTGSAEFALAGGTCAAGGTVAPGSSCSITLAFAPSTTGARSASLVVTHNAAGGQSSASLSGTGMASTPILTLSPATLAFSQTLGQTSVAQTIVIGNTGNAPLLLSALTLGGAQASEYQFAAGTTCVAGTSVPANGSCLVKIAFTPAASGARTASVAIVHNAPGSPATVNLNGTGTATPQPAIALNAAALTFAAQTIGTPSAAQTVTVGNVGAASLDISALTWVGSAAGDFARSGTCTAPLSLAPGANCSLALTFTPGAVGSRTATLTIASNASNGAAALSVAGTGAPVAVPAVALAPGALDFGNQTIGAMSGVRAVTLTNSGSGTLALASITATAAFAVGHNCGANLAPGASCTLSTSFMPTLAGAASGTLAVASNALGSPHTVALAGNGVAAAPALAWLPAATVIAFADTMVGGTPAVQTSMLSNQGPGATTLKALTISGPQGSDFSIGAGGSCAVGATLAAGASCTLPVNFQPGAIGPRSATLQVDSSGTNPPSLALSGIGAALAQPAVNVVPSAMSFSVTPGTTTVDPQTLMLQSTGNAVLHVSAWRVAAGAFTLAAAAVNGCPAAPLDLMPGQACGVAVAWSDPNATSGSGTVEIDTSAAATPLKVSIQAVRADVGGASLGPALSNAGAGGCSIARADSLDDPTLWTLVVLACLVLWRRRTRVPASPRTPPSNREGSA